MNFNVEKRTILKVRHGSHAYGLNVETSDVDLKGVCIEPLEYHLGFAKRFEQHIQEASKGHPHDLVIFSFKKFVKLASDCNPNVIEVLFVDEDDVLYVDDFGRELLNFRNNFISKKIKHTFSGYAHSQLKRIKLHREWLLNPPQKMPERSDFGLGHVGSFTKSEIGILESLQRDERLDSLNPDLVSLYLREKAYKNAKLQWDQYENWKKSRNPTRAELEAKYGFDTKHAMHLIRLMRTCCDVLVTGTVPVKRHDDREELLSIRRGELSYDEVIELAEKLEGMSDDLYKTTTIVPNSINVNLIDDFVVDLTKRYVDKYG